MKYETIYLEGKKNGGTECDFCPNRRYYSVLIGGSKKRYLFCKNCFQVIGVLPRFKMIATDIAEQEDRKEKRRLRAIEYRKNNPEISKAYNEKRRKDYVKIIEGSINYSKEDWNKIDEEVLRIG